MQEVGQVDIRANLPYPPTLYQEAPVVTALPVEVETQIEAVQVRPQSQALAVAAVVVDLTAGAQAMPAALAAQEL